MTEGRWRLVVDHNVCVGTGLCADTAPDCFTIEKGRSVTTSDPVDPDDVYRYVVEDCPVEAVAIYDAQSGARIAPPGVGHGPA